MKEFWTKITDGVEVSTNGMLKLDMKKLLSKNVGLNEEPIFVSVDTGTYYTNESKKKQVICTDTNEVFESSKAACKYYNLSSSTLCSCLKGHIDLAGGYHWAYYTE